ncbi:hypothetical protein ACFOET_04590 [Parapedobacter deserti]|uniref:Lipoprotein n=1 Tax=Parapedobacter deserti TaxID=1912957 RepID=A0ABV7JJD0_9SPHI
MKQLENKTIPRILTLALVVALTACGSKDDNKLTDNSAISDCLGVTIPIPQSATLTACTDAKVAKSASFSYAATWAEAVDFFEKTYRTNGWEITSERIDDEPGSMRTAEWRTEKNGTELAISLSDTRIDDTSGALQGVVLYFYE